MKRSMRGLYVNIEATVDLSRWRRRGGEQKRSLNSSSPSVVKDATSPEKLLDTKHITRPNSLSHPAASPYSCRGRGKKGMERNE